MINPPINKMIIKTLTSNDSCSSLITELVLFLFLTFLFFLFFLILFTLSKFGYNTYCFVCNFIITRIE